MVLKDPLSLGSFVRLLRRLRDALRARSHLSGSKGARFGTSHPFQSTCRPPGVGQSLARPGWALPSCPSPSAALRRRCGSRCPRPGSGPAQPARDEVSLPGRLSAQDGSPQPVFSVGTHLPARRRSDLHLRPPGLRAQSGAGWPGSLREHAVLLTGLLPQEPRRFGFPHGDTQYSPFPPGRGGCALLPLPRLSSPPPSPRQRILSRLPLRLPLLGCGGVLRGRQKGK